MLSEVANALFLTFLCSEYLLATPRNAVGISSSDWSMRKSLPRGFMIVLGTAVLFINLLDRVSGAMDVFNDLFGRFLHLPKAIFAAMAFVGALYLDVSRRIPTLSTRFFLAKVGTAFLLILPAYPFLAVFISVCFLFVINLWEALGWPLEWLNMPIYFGTLYGPFAWVYVYVKRRVLEEHEQLPS